MPDSSLYPVLFYSCIPDRFLPLFENDRQVFNTALYKIRLLQFFSHLPLSSAPLTLSPCPGTAYVSYSFLLQQNKRGRLTVCILSLLPNKRGRLFFCIFSLFSNTQRPLFCVRHFVIFCFCYPYFLVFRRKNICLLFENRHFFYFYSSLISVIL